jgi:tagatose 1,6-diphosphate aldolase GatY/KbaY
VEMCASVEVPVEGEIGRVGGKEDDAVCEDAGYTIPSEAVRFEKETGLSSMAVGVGTAHGVYRKTPVLNTKLIRELKGVLTVPMVLHGASGLSDEAVRECIHGGICKVNFATELRIAYSDGVKAALREKPDVFDPKVYGRAARARVRELVKGRMRVCGCDGKA